MRDFTEPEHVVLALARASDLSSVYVRSVLDDAHHVIDRAVCDDWSVLMSPLILGHRGDPVAEAVIDRFTPEDWADPWGHEDRVFR